MALAELQRAEGTDNLIGSLIEHLPPRERHEFMLGLSQRIVALEQAPGDSESSLELARWVGSWWLSVHMQRDDTFLAADREAQRRIDREDVGPLVSGADLRKRYGR